MYRLQVRGQHDLEVALQETSADDHEVPQAEVGTIHMSPEQEHLHVVSLREETSGRGRLLGVGLHHLEILALEVHSTRSVHVTFQQDLEDHHLLQNGSDYLHQDEIATMERDLPEGTTHPLARSVSEAATDPGPALLQGVMTGPRIRIILGDALRHLVPLDQLLLVLRDDLLLRCIQTGLV